MSEHLEFLISETDQYPDEAPEGYLCLYEGYFTHCRLWFPHPDLLISYYLARDIAIAQLIVPSVHNILVVAVVCSECGFEANHRFLESDTQISTNAKLS